jgi:hypothetical protein
MILTAIALSAASAAAPQVWVLDCVGNPAPGDERPASELSMTIRFQRSGRDMTKVEVGNPPTSGAFTRDLTRVSSDWRGSVTSRGYLFRSNERRSRWVEPGRIELRQSSTWGDRYEMTWSSYISGGHIIFDDSGSGYCRRNLSASLLQEGDVQ